ncbi:MAG: tRNA (adenosine(37)-N6)-threonylcarbamoyltransferase complex dimerization subunit type 1 TsaB [Thiomicrorhabdus sp.]|nr:tRNA (adenosine(37)-N6)-threonylcarbamoyltransferase complex dimerization subunit type 1 TsaB [Thiomicrorhabdus sp.]
MIKTYSILAIETSTVACSVALITKNQHYQRYEILPQKHALRALEMVDEVLSESGMTGVEIDVLAYGEGPGAFTGVRIASGVVQGLALGWDKPVIGVSSLEAMAERVLSELTSLETYANLDEISWCALMDARMKEVYFQSGTFNLKTKQWQVSEASLISPKEVEKRFKLLDPNSIGLGDVASEYPSLSGLFSTWFETLPSAAAVAQLVQRMALEDSSTYLPLALPVYLRNNVADTIEQRLQKRLKKAQNMAVD